MRNLLMLCLMLLACLDASAEPLPMEEAAPGIYVHHGIHEDLDQGYHGDICNVGFIVGKNGVAVIDSGGSLAVGQRLREAVRKVTPLPILYVINTHVHPDHIFGNAAFLADHPVFVGHANLAKAMQLRKDAYLRSLATWIGNDAAGSEMIPPTETVDATREIDLGERTLLLTAYPIAHTNTDLTVLDRTTATLWSGDLLFVERTPSIDGDIKGWLQALDQLDKVPAQRIIPGHGPVVADGSTAIANERRYLDTLLRDVRNSIRQGKTMEQTMQSAATSEQGKWVLYDIVNRRNVNLIYPALEWE